MPTNAVIALFRTLRRKGWSYAKEDSGMWLRNGDYFLEVLEDRWKLYFKIGENLYQINEKAFGRRQSQEITRSMEKDQKERRRCSSIHFNSKVDRIK